MNKEKSNYDNKQKSDLPPFNLSSDEEIEKIIEMNEKRKRMYHYTSMDTFYKLIGSINGGCFTFHAGSVYTMNDSQEMVLGYNKIKKYLPIVVLISAVA